MISDSTDANFGYISTQIVVPDAVANSDPLSDPANTTRINQQRVIPTAVKDTALTSATQSVVTSNVLASRYDGTFSVQINPSSTSLLQASITNPLPDTNFSITGTMSFTFAGVLFSMPLYSLADIISSTTVVFGLYAGAALTATGTGLSFYLYQPISTTLATGIWTVSFSLLSLPLNPFIVAPVSGTGIIF